MLSIEDWLEQSTAKGGVPLKVEDPEVIAALTVLVSGQESRSDEQIHQKAG